MRALVPTIQLDGGPTIDVPTLAALEPTGLALHVEGGPRKLRWRDALAAFKGPLGGEKLLRLRFREVLQEGAQLRNECDRVVHASGVGAPIPTALPLLESVCQSTKVPRDAEGFETMALGAALLCLRAIERDMSTIDRPLALHIIEELDRDLSRSVSALATHPRVREVEAVWRGLALMLAPVASGPPERCAISVDLVDVGGPNAGSIELPLAAADPALPAYAVLACPIARELAPRFATETWRVLECDDEPTMLRAALGSEGQPVRVFDYRADCDQEPLMGDACWLAARYLIEQLVAAG